jgi:hypothetical protein
MLPKRFLTYLRKLVIPAKKPCFKFDRGNSYDIGIVLSWAKYFI